MGWDGSGEGYVEAADVVEWGRGEEGEVLLGKNEGRWVLGKEGKGGCVGRGVRCVYVSKDGRMCWEREALWVKGRRQ